MIALPLASDQQTRRAFYYISSVELWLDSSVARGESKELL